MREGYLPESAIPTPRDDGGGNAGQAVLRYVVMSAAVVAFLATQSHALTTITAEDDVTYLGATPYNSSSPFGLYTRSTGTTYRSYVEFQLDSVPAASANLRLYNYWRAAQDEQIGYDVRIRGIGSNAPGYVQWTDTSGPAPSGAAHEDGSDGEPLWPVVVDSFHVHSEPGWYALDITTFYNSHLGEK